MIKKFGGIIQLNRVQSGHKLDYISHKTGISMSQLSRIERNKEKISFENARKIFTAMDSQIDEKDINAQFENDFQKFYEDIFYLRDCKASYQRIKRYEFESHIQASFSYVKYLLCQMIYMVAIEHNSQIDEYLIIENYFDYLEPYQIQLFYDYLATVFYYNNEYEKGLEYQNQALKYRGNDYSKSMVQYHKSVSLTMLGNLNDALECAIEARDFFAKTVNLKRLTFINFQIARIYSRTGNYKKSEELNLSCIEAFSNLGMTSPIGDTYNNLMWNFTKSGQYEKVIEYETEALDKTNYDHSICFYLSFAYFKKGKNDKAIYYIEKAQLEIKNPTQYMETVIKVFQIYLSTPSILRKEKQLLMAYDIASKSNDYELEIFTLELLKEFYHSIENVEKEYDCVNKLLGHYKNTN